ncbi:MAG TPA: hypothetical protein VFN35_05815 [Ktedonobacteraceae bacterium]|nr:hypothetical protein [Ktedonobacteraceae bacterium]
MPAFCQEKDAEVTGRDEQDAASVHVMAILGAQKDPFLKKSRMKEKLREKRTGRKAHQDALWAATTVKNRSGRASDDTIGTNKKKGYGKPISLYTYLFKYISKHEDNTKTLNCQGRNHS